MKRKILILFIVMLAPLLMSCGTKKTSKNTLTIFSAGDYIMPGLIEKFEKETGIDVIYEEYDTNEVMYTKISSPNNTYDLICTSDYMLEKLINENKLSKINKSNIPNYGEVSKDILELAKSFDPKNDYTVPYCYGTLGILYNSKYISKEEASSWNILWNQKYADDILMPDSVRDLLAVGFKKNGYSLNTSDNNALDIVEKDLKSQKNIVQAYVNDQVKDKMISGEAKLSVIYSGDALFTKGYLNDLDYVVPKEGSNMWIDAWAILNSSDNKEAAEKFINFISNPENAKDNYEYLTYSTAIPKAVEMTEVEELKNNEIVAPSSKILHRCEIMKDLGENLTRKYNDIFMRIKIE